MPAIVTIPVGTILPSLRWDVDWPVQMNKSDWSRGRKIMGLPGMPTWFVKASPPPMVTETAVRRWRSIIMQLEGPTNKLRLPSAPNQHPGPNPTMAAVNVSLKSMTLSSAAGLHDGMLGTVTTAAGYERMFLIVGEPSGAVINFTPELTDAPTVGAVVEIKNPCALVSLVGTKQGWDDNNGAAVFVFDAEESF